MAKQKQRKLYVDQYGNKFYASTVKELCEQIGRSKAQRMYCDDKNGKTHHVGYVIGPHWLTEYAPVRRPAY